MRIRIPRVVRNTALSIAVLAILALAAGTAYIFITDKTASTAVPISPMPVSATAPAGEIKPKAPSPNAREGVAVELVTTPVRAGSQASVAVRTNPTSTCTITATYNGMVSHDTGLTPQTADSFGSASWTWTVDTAAPVGTWPVDITCTYHGRSGVGRADLEVTR